MKIKFWDDSGVYNDIAVSISIIVSIVTLGIMGGLKWGILGIFLGFAGIPIGFLLGVLMVSILCRYFSDK